MHYIPHVELNLNLINNSIVHGVEDIPHVEPNLNLINNSVMWKVFHMWLPQINQTVVKTVEAAGFFIHRISSRDYDNLRGGIWDFSDSLEDEEDFNHLVGLVKINRFPGSYSLCKKDDLVLNYKWLQDRAGPECFNFLPESYALPIERKQLVEAMKADEESLWIVKPSYQACGQGIYIINRTIDLPSKFSKAPYCVQRYLTQPLLINKTKFDLRLYVLLTSIDPIRLYLYNEGLVRFASEKYCEDDLDNKFVHLTNFAVNRDRGKVAGEAEQEDGVEGSVKWSLGSLRKYFSRHGMDWSSVWREIEELCVKTVLTGHYDMISAYEASSVSEYSCYKLFGFDVILDQNLKPYLLEVNSFPSMFSSKIDAKINGPLVAEMFNILGFHQRSRTLDEDDVMQFYGRDRGVEDIEKEDKFMEEDGESQDLLHCLTARDRRIIQRSEQELSQTRNFTRLLPSKGYSSLLEVLDLKMYSDYLMLQWERNNIKCSGDTE